MKTPNIIFSIAVVGAALGAGGCAKDCPILSLTPSSLCGSCSASAPGEETWLRIDNTTVAFRFVLTGTPNGAPEYQYTVSNPTPGTPAEVGTYDLIYPSTGAVVDLYPNSPAGTRQQLAIVVSQDLRSCGLNELILTCTAPDAGASACGLSRSLAGDYLPE